MLQKSGDSWLDEVTTLSNPFPITLKNPALIISHVVNDVTLSYLVKLSHEYPIIAMPSRLHATFTDILTN